MQRLKHRCPCCDQPLGISWDMWGQYYLCSDCGFTAEDDDDLSADAAGKTALAQRLEITHIEAFRLGQTASRK